MKITSATFISSFTDIRKYPDPDKPEFAFIGRSNVGKSSLINALTNQKKLAKTSVKPGKTQTINHFLINESWYLVDLPGYGYASVSKSTREGFGRMIEEYVAKRENISCLFVLIDSRLEPQKNDLSFIHWAGGRGVPLAIIFTKSDKLNKNDVNKNIRKFEKALLEEWDETPPLLITSAETKLGREEVLSFIQEAIERREEEATSEDPEE